MHELSIVQSLMTTIEAWRDRNGSPRVLSAHIELGPLCGVDPEILRYAWETAGETCCPALRDCRLVMDLLKLRYHCTGCGKDFESEKLTAVCPSCGKDFPVRSGGHELNLKNIEVE